MALSGFCRFFKNLRYLSKYNLKDFNTYYSNIDNIVKKIKYETKAEWDEIVIPRVRDCFSTLNELVNSNKSIIRIGDGELTIIEGSDIPFQRYEESIAKSLCEILKDGNPNLLVGIGYDYYHKNTDLRDFVKSANYTSLPNMFDILAKNIDNDKIYYCSAISQVYAIYKNYDFENHFKLMRQIWNNKTVTIICGDRVFNNIEHNIFDNASKVDFIYGPTSHAYSEYETLKKRALEIDKNSIVIFALGPCGKVLAYDLFKAGYRVLDIGHSIKDYNEYKKCSKMSREEIIKFLKPD